MQVTSDQGTTCPAETISGIMLARYMKVGIDQIDRKKDFTTISAGTFITVVISLNCGDDPRGDSYDISADFFGLLNDEEIQFSMGIADIKPQK